MSSHFIHPKIKKPVYLLAIFIIAINLSYGQKVQSSCNAPDSVIARYKTDAYRLTLRRVERNNLHSKDSIILPQEVTDTTLRALIAIYNATDLKARDTIINVHTYPRPDLNYILISADRSLIWMRSLSYGLLYTGNKTVDGLIEKYYLKFYGYNYQKWDPYYDVAILKSDSLLNITPLTNIFNQLPGVEYSYPFWILGSGSDIKDSIFDDHIEIIFKIGWGDCPSGCIYNRFWKFNVYWDCSVEFVTSYGSKLPVTSVDEVRPNPMIIYPNPFSEKLIITGPDTEFNYTITNKLGQIIRSGRTRKEIEGMDLLPSDVYILKIDNDDLHSIHKIIKQ